MTASYLLSWLGLRTVGDNISRVYSRFFPLFVLVSNRHWSFVASFVPTSSSSSSSSGGFLPHGSQSQKRFQQAFHKRFMSSSSSKSETPNIIGIAGVDFDTNPKARVVPWSVLEKHYKADGRTFATDDEFGYLEEVESEESLQFARENNEACLEALGNPEETPGSNTTYNKVLSILESNDRIPYVRQYGVDPGNGDEPVLFNFWRDGTNPRGVWRRTTWSSYCSTDNEVEWTTVLDLDALGKAEGTSWVWKGSTPLPRARDPFSEGGKHFTRTLLKLSRGGADATVVREFDLVTEQFVADNTNESAFDLNFEAKTRISYKNRNVVYLGTDLETFQNNSNNSNNESDDLTSSGYPRRIREWVRGTPLTDAPVVWEGLKSDVSVSMYASDQRHRDGPIYEIRGRGVTFYTSVHEARILTEEQLLSTSATDINENPFVPIDIPTDAEFSVFGTRFLVSLRSDWTPQKSKNIHDDDNAVTYVSGSLLSVDAMDLLTKKSVGCDFDVLFRPTNHTALETYSFTRRYLILSLLEDVESRFVFFQLCNDDFSQKSQQKQTLVHVGGDTTPQIRNADLSAVDASVDDRMWFTTSSYLRPTTLCLADASKVVNGMATDGDGLIDTPYVLKSLFSLPPVFQAQGMTATKRFATSDDGTQVPYFVVFPAGYNKNQTTPLPTLLYGYGGFEISLGPRYAGTVGATWLERGGVYVEACIRGGGEYGPRWHRAALRHRRHCSFEDFCAVAEDLCRSGISSPSTLAIRGGSNGGLLVGNCYVRRPDLFAAVHCAVPLLDMRRYGRLLAGASWKAEYGDPDGKGDDPDMDGSDWVDYLHRYSPYHQIISTDDYDDEDTIITPFQPPPILFTTSTRDDRVHPAHARKMVAKLRKVGNHQWPVHYYENIEGGHGGAADAKQSAFMTALAYDFLWDMTSKTTATTSNNEGEDKR